ncbi:hypothetical protein C8J56DRAFT_597562 [Mycena floridula]|nr:hypothetical protein C8J56DRAFT_597562 [Mycena floridula]
MDALNTIWGLIRLIRSRIGKYNSYLYLSILRIFSKLKARCATGSRPSTTTRYNDIRPIDSLVTGNGSTTVAFSLDPATAIQPGGPATQSTATGYPPISSFPTTTGHLIPGVAADPSPMWPSQTRRYEKQGRLSKLSMAQNEMIERNSRNYCHRQQTPLVWVSCLHPAGNTYVRHAEMDILVDELPDAIAEINRILLFARSSFETLARPENVELVIEFREAAGWHYYFIDHEDRCIFWVHDVVVFEDYRLPGVTDTKGLKYAMETEYWYHCELFPHRPVKDTAKSELKGLILLDVLAIMTSQASAPLYDIEDLMKMLEILDQVESKATHYATCIVARLMSQFANRNFTNFHGHPGARLQCEHSVYSDVFHPRSIFMDICSVLLFRAPDIHLELLEKIFVDNIVSEIPWKQFIDKVSSEWQEITLFAGLILTTNVAFLAIPGIQSAAQISSYISAVGCLGSIAAGLILSRQNRAPRRGTAEQGATFLGDMQHSAFGFETLAILYSLPFALIMWATLFFAVSLALLIFQPPSLTTHVILPIPSIIVLLFVIWCLATNTLAQLSARVLKVLGQIKQALCAGGDSGADSTSQLNVLP